MGNWRRVIPAAIAFAGRTDHENRFHILTIHSTMGVLIKKSQNGWNFFIL
jgi:hypothetical protein